MEEMKSLLTLFGDMALLLLKLDFVLTPHPWAGGWFYFHFLFSRALPFAHARWSLV